MNRYAPMADAFAAGDWFHAFHPRFGALFSVLTGLFATLGFRGTFNRLYVRRRETRVGAGTGGVHYGNLKDGYAVFGDCRQFEPWSKADYVLMDDRTGDSPHFF